MRLARVEINYVKIHFLLNYKLIQSLPSHSLQISVIVPVFNEEQTINQVSTYFQQLSNSCELLFVDGKSTDATVNALVQKQFNVINTEHSNRGAQLYAGALHATGEILVFHHLDSRLPQSFAALINNAISMRDWGRFDVTLDSKDWRIRLIETAMNVRSRFTGIATGDQAMFMRKEALLSYAGDLADYPVMEDIYLSKQLKQVSKPACLHERVISSARYWQKNGVVKSILKMWLFRLLYFFGMQPQKLYHLYYGR